MSAKEKVSGFAVDKAMNYVWKPPVRTRPTCKTLRMFMTLRTNAGTKRMKGAMSRTNCGLVRGNAPDARHGRVRETTKNCNTG